MKIIPDVYQKNIFNINYIKLKKQGIKCLLFDLDNTIASKEMKKPTKKVIELINNLKEEGFVVIIFSNASYKRLKPFEEQLKIKVISRAFKPHQYKYKKFLKDYGFKPKEVAFIGDQILTDIKGGNKIGFTTIFVDRISKNDEIITKINRFRENKIFKKLAKENKFNIGKYYE